MRRDVIFNWPKIKSMCGKVPAGSAYLIILNMVSVIVYFGAHMYSGCLSQSTEKMEKVPTLEDTYWRAHARWQRHILLKI